MDEFRRKDVGRRRAGRQVILVDVSLKGFFCPKNKFAKFSPGAHRKIVASSLPNLLIDEPGSGGRAPTVCSRDFQ
jgi:hypothetical protein